MHPSADALSSNTTTQNPLLRPVALSSANWIISTVPYVPQAVSTSASVVAQCIPPTSTGVAPWGILSNTFTAAILTGSAAPAPPAPSAASAVSA